MTRLVPDLEALLEPVTDGCSVAVPPDYSGVALAATRALLKRGVRHLHLIAVPQAGLQADVLIGAGAVVTQDRIATLDEVVRATLADAARLAAWREALRRLDRADPMSAMLADLDELGRAGAGRAGLAPA